MTREVAKVASRACSEFWLKKMRKIEEEILDPTVRWEMLRKAIEIVRSTT
jgi:hypothetical protein